MGNNENRKEIFENLVHLSQISSINGIIHGDGQSLFLGETLKVVLGASLDEKHARLMHGYIQKFLNHIATIEGQMKVVDLLKEETSAN